MTAARLASRQPVPATHRRKRLWTRVVGTRAGLHQHWWALVTIVVGWLTVVAWRPLMFGFYADDWLTLVWLDYIPLARQFQIDVSRPLLTAVTFVGRKVFGANPVLWQGGLALTALATAIALYVVSCRMLDPRHPARPSIMWASAVASLAWLSFPWALGYMAWPVMFAPMLAVLCFLLCMICLFSPSPSQWKLVAFAVLFVAAGLIYEAFWLAIAPALVMYVVWGRQVPARGWRHIASALILGGAAQAALIVWNRSAGSTKQYNEQWLSLLSVDKELFPIEMAQVIGPWIPLLLTSITLLALGSLYLVRRRSTMLLACWMAPGCIAGIGIAAVLYSLAGYAVEWNGLLARTSASVSVWLALLVALAVYLGARGPHIFRLATVVGCCGLLLSLGAATFARSGDWSRAWAFEQQLLRGVPADEIARVGQGGWLLVDFPRPDTPVETFSAYWDMSGALLATYPQIRDNLAQRNSTMALVARRGQMVTTWDGNTVSQAWCAAPTTPLWTFSGVPRLTLWRYPSDEVVALTPPFTLGCGEQP